MSTLSATSEQPNLSSIPRTPLAMAGISLVLGFAVEILFHQHQIGVSFPIWAALGIAAILVTSKLDSPFHIVGSPKRMPVTEMTFSYRQCV